MTLRRPPPPARTIHTSGYGAPIFNRLSASSRAQSRLQVGAPDCRPFVRSMKYPGLRSHENNGGRTGPAIGPVCAAWSPFVMLPASPRAPPARRAPRFAHVMCCVSDGRDRQGGQSSARRRTIPGEPMSLPGARRAGDCPPYRPSRAHYRIIDVSLLSCITSSEHPGAGRSPSL